MREVITYTCKDWQKEKDCQREIVIPKPVYELMLQRGESLPERCEHCRKKHLEGIAEIKAPYFQVELESEDNLTTFDYYESAYTSHGDRQRRPGKVEPIPHEMKIRITDQHMEQLYNLLEKNQIIVLASPTGTGKSIYTLYRLVDKPEDYSGDFVDRLVHQGQIIQTQPLSEAVNRIPKAIDKLLGEPEVGAMQTLGLRHRGNEKYDRHNLGVVVTDGSLRNWVREGHLGQYSLIMIDEAHKRTLNIDTLLLFLKYQLSLYPHLKVIISSATINIDEFKEAFGQEGISVGVFDLSESLKEDANYHVHYWENKVERGCDCWLCRDAEKRKRFWDRREEPPQQSELPDAVADFVIEILKETKKGSILAFLPGEAVIEKTKKLIDLKKRGIDPKEEIPVITIYSRLGEDEVTKRFDLKGKERRVLLTTDIAETSHTLEDLVYVIDSGYIKESRWDPQTETSSLPVDRHSQAGCRQRYGRVGRNQRGYVYCLYTLEQFENEQLFRRQTAPELLRSPLDDVLLNLKAAGVTGDPSRLIGKWDKEGALQTEISRSSRILMEQGFTDEKGNVTESALEIFNIPKSASDIALMNLADEHNCLTEMITSLSLMRTDEGAVRTGAGLYDPLNGLFTWDPRWTARTKLDVWKIHKALLTGCTDDLDLVIKIAVCFLKAERKGKGKEWALRHFVNYDLIRNCLLERMEKGQKIPPEREALLDKYRIKARKEEVRGEIDLDLLDRVRAVLAAALPSKTIKLTEKAGLLTYRCKTEGAERSGSVSEYCAGDWADEDEAILLAAAKATVISNGHPERIPVGSFLVRLPGTDDAAGIRNLFLDQRFPVGSRVSVKQKNGKYFISDIIQAPPSVRIDYRIRNDFEMLLNDFLRSSYLPKGETIRFFDEFIDEDLKRLIGEAEAVWVDERKSGEAKIVEWKRMDGIPKAIIAPVDDLTLLSKIRKEMKSGDNLTVKVEKVARDPGDKRGWILAKTREGLEVPIEMGDMSLSHLGYGLEHFEGEWLELSIREFEGVMRRPRLGNIDKVIQDLEEIRKEIAQAGEMVLEGYVEDIDQDEGKVIVVVFRNSGVVHFFEVSKRHVMPGSEQDVTYLRIGEKVIVALSMRNRDRGEWRFSTQGLPDYQIKSIPRSQGLKYDKEEERLVAYCVKEAELENWEAPAELKDIIVKNSWRYIFNVTIVVRDAYQILKEGDHVFGTVVEIPRDTETGRIHGLRVRIESGGFELAGFVPFSQLKKTWDDDKERWVIPEIDQIIELYVIREAELANPRVILRQKEAEES